MVDKNGGDIAQANMGTQGNMSAQDLNSVAAGGAGVQEAMGGAADAMGAANQAIQQAQNQANMATSGDGGDDNINANTTINIT
ncbi:MAG TPA: hypothetical protein DD979_16670 [Gammaproteobacteria bacterium]|jgi:hypothetical protein|nr:hypothetical protein [Gammaproteobacteria bacterium]